MPDAVTGISMEFQFGTSWSEFSRRRGGIIGQPLAREGVFSFFLESSFLGPLLVGEMGISRGLHRFTVLVFIGRRSRGFFIIVTDAWMPRPFANRLLSNGCKR